MAVSAQRVQYEQLYKRLMASAKKIGQLAEKEALEADEQCTISENVINLMKQEQIHRLIMPPEYGYPQIDFTTFTDMVKTVGYYNLSAAWLTYFFSLHNSWVAYLPKRGRDEVYHSDGLVADILAPVGRVEKVEGGYILNGTWHYVSGINYSEWCGFGAFYKPENEEMPTWLVLNVNKKDFKIINDWNSIGLRGSGSNTVIVENTFVPEHHTFEFGKHIHEVLPDEKVDLSYLYYDLPFYAAFFVGFPAMSIGAAERALDEFVEGSKKRFRIITNEQESSSYRSQRVAAVLALKLAKAKGLMKEYIRMLESDKGGLYDPSVYKALRVEIIDECVGIAQKATMSLGAKALLKGHPLEMILRDLITIGTHITSLYEDGLESYGKHLFGYPSNALG
ncbi:flavin-dependent monooxygenase [Kyrpidia sp.]|uniref:flavin-dependent monooxygenase n=1 Tax=Kyrpidia sp. TaxID=2073077 RepID=UPI002583DB71|nr:flavin-dependent monooxygenase [Kyrpidia sp.]MCL6577254.1 flavin-dependent monooxygenase [Kyrpidia sp.]